MSKVYKMFLIAASTVYCLRVVQVVAVQVLQVQARVELRGVHLAVQQVARQAAVQRLP